MVETGAGRLSTTLMLSSFLRLKGDSKEGVRRDKVVTSGIVQIGATPEPDVVEALWEGESEEGGGHRGDEDDPHHDGQATGRRFAEMVQPDRGAGKIIADVIKVNVQTMRARLFYRAGHGYRLFRGEPALIHLRPHWRGEPVVRLL